MSQHWGRKIAHVPADPVYGLKRTCIKCGLVKPVQGGTIRHTRIGQRFICAGCREPTQIKRESCAVEQHE